MNKSGASFACFEYHYNKKWSNVAHVKNSYGRYVQNKGLRKYCNGWTYVLSKYFLTRKLALINYISALCINFLKKYTYKEKGFEAKPLCEFSCKKCVSSFFGSQVKVLRKCECVCVC